VGRSHMLIFVDHYVPRKRHRPIDAVAIVPDRHRATGYGLAAGEKSRRPSRPGAPPGSFRAHPDAALPILRVAPDPSFVPGVGVAAPVDPHQSLAEETRVRRPVFDVLKPDRTKVLGVAPAANERAVRHDRSGYRLDLAGPALIADVIRRAIWRVGRQLGTVR